MRIGFNADPDLGKKKAQENEFLHKKIFFK
jgi:hypothetical protein